MFQQINRTADPDFRKRANRKQKSLTRMKIGEAVQERNTHKITDVLVTLHTTENEAEQQIATFRHEVTLESRIGMNRGPMH